MLAGGAGSRFLAAGGAGHKLLAPWRGRTVVWSAVRAAVDADIGPVVVVSRSADLTGALPEGVEVRHNPAWAQGQATSLQVAIAAAAELDATAVVVGLGDQPLLTAEAWRAVAATTATSIAVATYDGRRGGPVRLAADIWPLLPATGDEGARVLMRRRPDLVTEVACNGDPADIDTVEDLTAWSWPTISE